MRTKLKILGVLMLLIASAFTASAYDFEVSGIYYNKTSGTEVEVTSGGSKYSGSVTIPASVTYGGTTYSMTSIGDYAFYECSGLTSVTIGNSVTSIGENAFSGCSGLTSVNIPNSVTSIGDYAFAWCRGLTSVTIGNSVTKIGNNAFAYCSDLIKSAYPNHLSNPFSYGISISYDANNSIIEDGFIYNTDKTTLIFAPIDLTSVTIPNSMTSIGNYAFRGCSGLSKVSIADGNTALSINKTFADCPLSEVYIGRNLNYDSSPFSGKTNLKTVTIGNSVTSIGNYAFDGCYSLTSVTIGNSVTSIGNYAFDGCYSLTSVTIGNSVTSIGEDAFDDCNGLTAVHISDLAAWCKIEFGNYNANPLYYADNIYLNGEKVTNLVIPNSVTSIGEKAFCYCRGLTSVTIPNSVTEIGSQAFYNCSGLTSVTIGNSVTSIGDYAFYECSGLTSVTIGSGVTKISHYAFSYYTYGNGDTKISIPKVIWLCNTPPSGAYNVSANVNYVSNEQFSISNRKVYPFLSSKFEVDGVVYVPVSPSERTCDVIDCNYAPTTTDIVIDSIVSNKNVQLKVLEVNSYAFYGNDNITGLKIQNSGNIGNQAFYDCDALTTVEASNNGYIGNSAFYDCSAITTANLSNKGYIGDQAFYGCSKLESVTFGSKVSSIGKSAFYNCNTLKSLTLPDNISSLGESSFEKCSSLSNVSIGKDIISLPNSVFSGCSSLPSLTIPGNILSIGNYAFSACTQLADVTFEEVNKDSSQISISLGSNDSSPLFVDCPLDEVYIGRKLSYQTSKSYGYSPFYCNTSLRSVIISDIETQIYDNEFYGCTKLESVTFGSKVSSIGESAFYNCNTLKSLTLPDNISSLGDSSFENCSSLSNVSIGKGISSLPTQVFSGCSSLPSLTIPGNILSIGNYAFFGCTQLADVTFEEVNKDSSQILISLGSNGSSPLFASCPLDEVYIGRKLSYQTSKSYGYSPFYRNTSLRSVIISDIETQIYDNEFYGCTNLQEFSCGDGVTTIGKWAFSGCSAMTSFASGSKVESISEEAFSDCTGLTSFTSFAAVPPTCGNQALDDINKWECVLHVPAESISAYQAADQWKEFFFMEEIQGGGDVSDGDVSGVDDVIADEASGEVVGYYNLQGVRSDEPWDGLNIVVYSDGTRRKIRY